MIDRLHLRNFKCFLSQPFALKALTVLCGHNGAGKSSAIQSLLLAQQLGDVAVAHTKAIPLNGPFHMQLGAVADVFSQDAEDRVMEISVTAAGQTARISFRANDEDLESRFLSGTLNDHELPSSLRQIGGFHFAYLSAERLGPRDTQAMQSRPRDKMIIGARGEFVAEVLATFGRDEIRAELCHTASITENRRLSQQVEFWMGEWMPGLQLRADLFAGTNVAAIRIQRRDVTSEWMRPTNVGFGISHSLPIVVAGLLAPADGIFIVDSPESHLHPKAQSAVAGFLSTVAASGTQVIIETHSDHVLNGVRLAAKRNQVQARDVAIYYFDRSGQGSTTIITPQLTQDGKLTEWPPGFFDQWETALHELL
jgi:predicted ATPase